MNEANIKRDAKRILKAVKTLQPLATGEDRVFDPETGVGYSVGEQLNHIEDAVQGILGEIGAAHTDLNQSKKLKSSRKSVGNFLKSSKESLKKELENYCNKHGVYLQFDENPDNTVNVAIDDFTNEEKLDIGKIVYKYVDSLKEDSYLAGNGHLWRFSVKDDIQSSRKSVKSGFYDDPVNHPEGGGTCDYCGADVAPGDYYEANFDSTHDHAAMQLYLALGGDPKYAYEVVENIHNFVIWLQQVDENIDEDTVQDMISEVVDMAFPNYNDYFCHDCLDSRLKDAANKWVEENW